MAVAGARPTSPVHCWSAASLATSNRDVDHLKKSLALSRRGRRFNGYEFCKDRQKYFCKIDHFRFRVSTAGGLLLSLTCGMLAWERYFAE